VRNDRAGEPHLADMAGFAAGRLINLCDFSYNIQVGAFLKQNLYDFSYNIQTRGLLEAEFV